MPLSPYARYGTSTITGTNTSARRHVVKGGETLPAIAFYEYPGIGYDSELWRQIAEANNIDDLDVLTVNTVLTIPPPASSST